MANDLLFGYFRFQLLLMLKSKIVIVMNFRTASIIHNAWHNAPHFSVTVLVFQMLICHILLIHENLLEQHVFIFIFYLFFIFHI